MSAAWRVAAAVVPGLLLACGNDEAGPADGTTSPAPVATTTTTSPVLPTAPSPTDDSGVSPPRATPDGTTEAFERVIVDIDVEWGDEPALTGAERARRRRWVESAQDEILADLDGHGVLVDRFTASAQLSLDVDAAGRQLLVDHPLVARVHDTSIHPPDD